MNESDITSVINCINEKLDPDEPTFELHQGYYLYNKKKGRYHTKWGRKLSAMYDYVLGYWEGIKDL